MTHAVPEGNSSTADTIALIQFGILPPAEESRDRDYQPRHEAQETHPLTDRPTVEIEGIA